MTMNTALKLIESIVKEYKYSHKLKELSFRYSDVGALYIGGRTMLVEELNQGEYDARCILVVFAGSSRYIGIESVKQNLHRMDQLHDILEEAKLDIDIANWIKSTVKEKLVSVAPSLVNVEFKDERST